MSEHLYEQRPLHIEQAIYASQVSDRMSGYQICAASSGIDANTSLELSTWGPAHDALVDSHPFAASVNFFRLNNGSPVVAFSQAVGGEYSDRKGQHICTRFLVLDAEGFARYSHNPFSIIEAAKAAGHLEWPSPPTKTLDAITLGGSAGPLDQILLRRLARRWGPKRLLQLLDAALVQPRLFVRPPRDASWAIAAILSLAPAQHRLELTFTTGLRFSNTRPFRIHCMVEEHRNRLRTRVGPDAMVFHLDVDQNSSPIHEWSKKIGPALLARQWSRIETQLRQAAEQHAECSESASSSAS